VGARRLLEVRQCPGRGKATVCGINSLTGNQIFSSQHRKGQHGNAVQFDHFGRGKKRRHA
jgi:hypothetical protein